MGGRLQEGSVTVFNETTRVGGEGESEERREAHEVRDHVAEGLAHGTHIPLVDPLFKSAYNFGEAVDDETGMSDEVLREMNETDEWFSETFDSPTLGRIMGGLGVIPATLAAPLKAVGRGLGLDETMSDHIRDAMNQQWLDEEGQRIAAAEAAHASPKIHADLQYAPKEPVQQPREAIPKSSVFRRPAKPTGFEHALPAGSVFNHYAE